MNNDNNAALHRLPEMDSGSNTQGRKLNKTERKAIVAATLGTIVEYTDWVIYATFSSILARQFSPVITA